MDFIRDKTYLTNGGEAAVYMGENQFVGSDSTKKHVFVRQNGQVFTTNKHGKLRLDDEEAWCNIVGEW